MLKISGILSVSAAVLLLTACGGSGSDSSFSSFSSTKKFGSVNYVCTTRAAADACLSDNTCAAQSDCKKQGGGSSPVAACSVSGNNVSVPYNSQCTYSNSGINSGAAVTYTCSNGTVSGGGFSSNNSITLNGTTISCVR